MLAVNSLSALLFSSLILSFSVPALADHSKGPTKCPSVAAIQKVGLNYATLIDNKKWLVVKLADKYDTENTWMFAVGEFSASDAMDALKKARHVLTALTFQDGPNKSGREEWECTYKLADGYRARAMTPPFGFTGIKLFQ